MERFVDLHIHTSLSDGTFSPEKVVEYSKEKGLTAISITDHDSCEGIEPAIKKGKELGLEVIPGVELTAELDDEEIHILGYFIDHKNESFLKKLDHIIQIREKRAMEILKKLREKGLDIEDKELYELSGKGSIGRLHIAHLLHKKGYVSSITKAFRDYIGNNASCHVKKFKLSPKEAVDMIKKVGGIAVLAHPAVIYPKKMSMEEIIDSLVKDGIEGMEIYHSDHRRDDEERFKVLASRYNLLVTGGSDCHGLAKREVLIGKVKAPYKIVDELRARIKSREEV